MNRRSFNNALWGGIIGLVLPITAHAASFQALGDLVGGTTRSEGHSVSPNGEIVVGSSIGTVQPSGQARTSAFKWTSGGGIVGLNAASGSQFYSNASGATNSDVVTGYSDLTGNFYGQIIQWPAGSTTPTTLPLNPPWQRLYSYTAEHPIAINSGGATVIAGYVAEIPYTNSIEPAVWVNGTIHTLGWLAPGPLSPPPGPTDPPRDDPIGGGYKDYGYTFGINGPATHIVGYSQSGFLGTPEDEADPHFTLPQAVLWHDPTGTWATPPAAQSLGFIGGPTVSNSSTAVDITNNGLTVVGSGCINMNCGGATPTGHSEAFIGTVGNNNLTAIGVLPVNDVSVRAGSRASAIAGNGTVVVGWSNTDVPVMEGTTTIEMSGHTAFIYDPVLTGGTMMNLKTYLTNSQGLGAPLTGWKLLEANDISDDGRVIVGTGLNPSGNFEAFRVTIDLTVTNNGDYNGDHVVNAADYTKWRDTLGAHVAQGSGADGNNNGMIDDGDYTFWKSRFGMNVGSGAGSAGLAVPEPAAALLFAIGSLGLIMSATRRR